MLMSPSLNTVELGIPIKRFALCMTILTAEGESFGKVFTSADSNFSRSEANAETCRLAGDSAGEATAVEECEYVGVAVVESGALLEEMGE